MLEISNNPVVFDYVAAEFRNYIMIALEGQRFVRLEKNYKEDIRENAENILYLLFSYNPNHDPREEEPSALDISKVLSRFGDVLVVKDSVSGCFAEFQHFDD